VPSAKVNGTVSGLRPGGWVLFNGLRVGEVASLRIDPEAPRQVIAVIHVDKNVVLRQDTGVALEFQGLTGNLHGDQSHICDFDAVVGLR
jgi:phospholipid/cholesterol/gamma-HCH transport system substrate-binding protein